MFYSTMASRSVIARRTILSRGLSSCPSSWSIFAPRFHRFRIHRTNERHPTAYYDRPVYTYIYIVYAPSWYLRIVLTQTHIHLITNTLPPHHLVPYSCQDCIVVSSRTHRSTLGSSSPLHRRRIVVAPPYRRIYYWLPVASGDLFR